MKIIYSILIIFLFASSLFAKTNKIKKIEPGMLFSDAKNILLNIGIEEEERYFDIEIPEDIKVSYFSIEEKVDLVISCNKRDEKIIFLSVTFYPRYQPVKGLETHKSLDYIIFDSESYIIKIKKEEKLRSKNKINIKLKKEKI